MVSKFSPKRSVSSVWDLAKRIDLFPFVFLIFIILIVFIIPLVDAAEFEGSSISSHKASQNVPDMAANLSSSTLQNGKIQNQGTDNTIIGTVSPSLGVIQAWDEKDPLHALTYTLQLQKWNSPQAPVVQLCVREYGSLTPWRIVGDKKTFNPSAGSVSWTLKPFSETPFLGKSEFRFIIDGVETRVFPGTEIIAVLSKAGDSLNGRVHNFEATAISSLNLTVCLVGGDSRLPENIKSWTTIGQCQNYRKGSGEQAFKWQIPEIQAPPYYDFNIKINEVI